MEEEKDARNKAWREGYDLGVRITLKDNDVALKLGNAILEAMYDKFEPRHENYD